MSNKQKLKCFRGHDLIGPNLMITKQYYTRKDGTVTVSPSRKCRKCHNLIQNRSFKRKKLIEKSNDTGTCSNVMPSSLYVIGE